jgi:hypothetical protein
MSASAQIIPIDVMTERQIDGNVGYQHDGTFWPKLSTIRIEVKISNHLLPGGIGANLDFRSFTRSNTTYRTGLVGLSAMIQGRYGTVLSNTSFFIRRSFYVYAS